MEFSIILGTMALLILICLFSSKISSWLNVPTLIMFLAVGMLAGSEGVGKLAFDNATVANYIGSFAMAFILFAGGFDTRWKSVRSVLGYGGLLASVGVLLTAIFVGVLTWGLLQWITPEKGISLSWCLLLGSIISSTDAAAVFAILRSKNVSLRGDLQPLLEFESGSNDPMAAFLTIFMVGVVSVETATGQIMPWTGYWIIVPTFLIKMSLGILIGYAIARLAIWAYNKFDFEYDGLYYVLAFSVAILTFSLAELSYGNGFMAVYVAGLTMGNKRFIYHHSIGRYYDGMAWLMQVVLFTMLGLLAFPHQLWNAKWIGLAVAIILMLIARPVAVFLCMIRSKFNINERLLVSWVGLRGGAPIMLATFPLMAKIENDQLIFHIVFFIVLTSVLLQGMTLMPMARALKLAAPLRKSARIPLTFDHTGVIDAESRGFIVDELAQGKTLAQLDLPKEALVMLIHREEQFIIPRGNTVLEKDDHLMIIGPEKTLEEVGLRLDIVE
jgi:cell volume regulation protein A